MTAHRVSNLGSKPQSTRRAVNVLTAAILVASAPAWAFSGELGMLPAQAPSKDTAPLPAQATPPAASSAPASNDDSSKQVKGPRNGDRRKAAKLFLEASKQFEKEQFQESLKNYLEAAALDPGNRNYGLAAELARSHAATALVQAAARHRIRGDAAAERAALEQALALDPRNVQVTEHLHELGDEAARTSVDTIYGKTADSIDAPLEVAATDGVLNFHLHADQRQVIQQVFKGFGLQATVDDSVRLTQVRFDVDNANFVRAMRALSLVTNSFYVPLDAHRVLVARDTRENRRQFERQQVETIYLPGLTTAEITDVGSLAKNVFELNQSALDPTAGTITIRAGASSLNAFNSTIRDLLDGHNQVLLDVTLIQLAHTSDRITGVQPPQAISAFNVYAEEQSILNSNQSLVQQIVSSGLAAPGDTLAIIGILVASGQVSSSLFSQGIALFGGGITQSALSPGTATAHLNLNSSDSRQLDHLLLRLADGTTAGSDAAAGTIKSGTRYPIQTSSFSSLSGSASSIAGLTGAGTSSSLSSLLGSLSSEVPNVPQVEYQDLGLTLKATPRVMRNSEVALTLDMKIDALSGSSLNGNPILNNRAYSGVVTLKEGEGVVIVSELDKQESRAISGYPGLSEIPGLNDVTDKDKQRNTSTLLIVMTPHVLRGTQARGHSPMLRIERNSNVR